MAALAELEKLLATLLELHEHGISHSGGVSREAFRNAALKCALRMAEAERGELKLAGEAVETSDPNLAVELKAKGKRLGELRLWRRKDAPPLSDTRSRALSILAAETAAVFHNLELIDHLQEFYLEVVQTLSRAIEAQDRYSKGQSDRARALARAMAEKLRMSDVEGRNVEYAAMLHRVGKIGIDQTLLNKPGKLTPKEYEEIKRYTVIGHQILAPAKFLGPVAEIVLYHQEWYNGQGYPEGRKGEAIPLGSRIVAVINAWEAMTSDRPYRKAMTADEARAQLLKGSGSQFDPSVVEAFLAVEPSKNGA